MLSSWITIICATHSGRRRRLPNQRVRAARCGMCALLHLDPTALKDALASRTLETMAPGGKTETYQVPLNPTPFR